MLHAAIGQAIEGFNSHLTGRPLQLSTDNSMQLPPLPCLTSESKQTFAVLIPCSLFNNSSPCLQATLSFHLMYNRCICI